MAVVYFDSSAFVKLLVEEEGSELAAQLWDGCDAAVSSRLAYPEVRAALAAGARGGRLDRQAHEIAEASWEEFWSATRVIEMTEAVAQHAGDLAREHSLRGADAVHLASSLVLGAEAVVLAAWDTQLRLGAEAAGISVVPDA